jgi:hypothetical protein
MDVKRVLAALLVLSASAVPALGDEFGRPRAFWLQDQAWPNPRREAETPAPKFTKTYMDGIARRFGMVRGHMDVFEQKIGGASGPGLAATIDGGAAKLELRWHPDE